MIYNINQRAFLLAPLNVSISLLAALLYHFLFYLPGSSNCSSQTYKNTLAKEDFKDKTNFKLQTVIYAIELFISESAGGSPWARGRWNKEGGWLDSVRGNSRGWGLPDCLLALNCQTPPPALFAQLCASLNSDVYKSHQR